ncbi:hypothetical protein V7457_21350 [Bacillus toyonensis]|uniref:hypothetical protein n=1 Tax=Bacillus cereus group TaxID=86661 RepID=UPI000BF20A55|nr:MULTISPECIES: hypothetical protein [Bacillus cereus group]PEM87420.1 hypothetical protein CN629_24210 [Bacillus toyonensis]PEQ69699.1 hypothetical protein CN474_19920 [Bacillus thuringiensis]
MTNVVSLSKVVDVINEKKLSIKDELTYATTMYEAGMQDILKQVAEQIFEREKFDESQTILEYEGKLKEIMNSTLSNINEEKVNELDDTMNYYCALSSLEYFTHGFVQGYFYLKRYMEHNN